MTVIQDEYETGSSHLPAAAPAAYYSHGGTSAVDLGSGTVFSDQHRLSESSDYSDQHVSTGASLYSDQHLSTGASLYSDQHGSTGSVYPDDAGGHHSVFEYKKVDPNSVRKIVK